MEGRSFFMVSVVTLTVILTLIEASSIDKGVSVCLQPPETGVCRASIPQWFFNATTNRCEGFIYGGCLGSRNRFPTREECIQICSPETCSLPAEEGGCRASIRLWYFDALHRKCHQFTYGGCEGNENKFTLEHTCLVACGKSSLQCPLGDKFTVEGHKAVHTDYRHKEYLLYKCESRCESLCLESHPWGHCMAFSMRKRWYGCNCYLFSRYVSESEFDPDTKGVTKNRNCDESGG